MNPRDLTTLAHVKQWLGEQTTTNDALLARLITSLSAYIQAWLNREIASRVYVDTYEGWGAVVQPLRNGPVTAVSSVVINGTAIPATTDNPSDPAGFYFD